MKSPRDARMPNDAKASDLERAIDCEGDCDPFAIYAAVGMALSQWEMLESVFAEIYAELLSNKSHIHREAAKSSYGMVQGSSVRTKMLKEVTRIVFLDPPLSSQTDLSEQILALIKEMEKLSSVRNNIAHGCVVSYTLNNQPQGNFVVPSYYNSVRRKGVSLVGLTYKYNTTTVRLCGAEFSSLYLRATKVFGRLLELEGDGDADIPSAILTFSNRGESGT